MIEIYYRGRQVCSRTDQLFVQAPHDWRQWLSNELEELQHCDVAIVTASGQAMGEKHETRGRGRVKTCALRRFGFGNRVYLRALYLTSKAPSKCVCHNTRKDSESEHTQNLSCGIACARALTVVERLPRVSCARIPMIQDMSDTKRVVCRVISLKGGKTTYLHRSPRLFGKYR